MDTRRTPRFEGIFAAPFTPFHEDGRLRLEIIERQAEALARAGLRGAFVCGTTGEGLSLTTGERRRVAERWRAVTAGSALRLIVHAGHTSGAEARELAAHAQTIGADAVAVLAPFFARPATVDDLVAFCADVASAAPDLPFFYYHIPAMTGVSLPVADVLARAAERIPNLAGAKFTDNDLMDFSRCVAGAGDRLDLLFGRDEILLAALALGARGAVGSTYNFAAPLFNRLWAAFEHGDLEAARREQARAVEIIAILLRHGGLPAAKSVMAWRGVDCGPVRPPLRRLDPTQQAALRAELERIGFFERDAQNALA